MSSSSRYSTDDVTSAFPSTAVATAPSTSTSSLIPLDTPGTVESDAEADGLLSMADSGPAAVHADRGTELLEKEEEERKKRKHHKPSKEEVNEAKALLAEK
jgi:hypothetical protein